MSAYNEKVMEGFYNAILYMYEEWDGTKVGLKVLYDKKVKPYKKINKLYGDFSKTIVKPKDEYQKLMNALEEDSYVHIEDRD